jgi:hypothetical protein
MSGLFVDKSHFTKTYKWAKYVCRTKQLRNKNTSRVWPHANVSSIGIFKLATGSYLK